MEQNNAFLGTAPIGKLMRGYALPCIISLLVGALYNIVDQIFIANASYLGSYGNASNTVVFPLTVVALAIAVMVGDGCCAFVSISLGRQEGKKASRSVGNAVLLCVAASLILTAVYLIFADQIIAMFGGTVNEETFLHSQEYFFYITIGIPLYMFGQAMNPVIRADGSPRFAMVSTLAGAIANIILDPVFIFCFRWGMMGAAVATVIGQAVTAALAGSNYQGGEMIDYLRSKVDNLTVVDTDAACAELGSSKIVNVLLLGAAVNSGETGLTKDDIRTAIKEKVNPKFHELNFKALDYLK